MCPLLVVALIISLFFLGDMEEKAEEETFMSDYEQGKLVKPLKRLPLVALAKSQKINFRRLEVKKLIKMFLKYHQF